MNLIILPAQRPATVEDVIRRLRAETYQSYALTALGWGMGDAQIDIDVAVAEAQAAGLVTTVRDARSRKTMVALTDAGRSCCAGSQYANVEHVYGATSARCACGTTLRLCQRADGQGTYWTHPGTGMYCPAYECGKCGHRHNAARSAVTA